MVFLGVGKTAKEMGTSTWVGIFCFNVESAAELERLNTVAGEQGKSFPVSLRVNPNVDPKTHPISQPDLKKQSLASLYDDALNLYRRASSLPNIEVSGIDCHIGSQLLDPAPFTEAL